MGCATIGIRGRGGGKIKGIKAAQTEFPMFRNGPVMNCAQADFAGAADLIAGQQFLALDGLAAREQSPGFVRLVLCLEQNGIFVGTVGEMLVAERQGGGNATEIELLEISGAGGEPAL